MFPLGMTAAASFAVAQAERIRWISLIGDILVWSAFAAWALTLIVAAKRLATKMTAGGVEGCSPVTGFPVSYHRKVGGLSQEELHQLRKQTHKAGIEGSFEMNEEELRIVLKAKQQGGSPEKAE